jgi:hypothetical protein
MRKLVCWPRWGGEREMTAAIHRAGGNGTTLAQDHSSFAHPALEARPLPRPATGPAIAEPRS